MYCREILIQVRDDPAIARHMALYHLWVQTLLISSDDRQVSDFLFFHLRLRYYGSSASPTSKDGRRKMRKGNSSLLGTSYYPLMAVPRSEFGFQHFFCAATNAALRGPHPSLPDRLPYDLRE